MMPCIRCTILLAPLSAFIMSTFGFAAPLLFAAPEPIPLPNIVLIVADDLGYADLGCYGGKAISTPRLDRMAAEGLRITQAYSGSTVCAPSRCSLLTGKHSGHSQIRGNRMTPPEGQVPLLPGTVTLPSLLKRAGYATGAFGKWGLGGPGSTGEPAKQGFDAFFGYLCQKAAHEYYPPMLRRNSEAVSLDGRTYSHSLIFEEALEFVRRQRKHPFFLYIPVTLPHGKLDVPDASAYADRPWPQAVKNYAAMVSLLDKDVGRLLDLLAELSLDENTLVLFTSDNGAEVYYFKADSGGTDSVSDYVLDLHSNGELRGFKRDLYEGGIRVPFIARWPGRIRPGVTDHILAFWDVLPTLADLAAQEIPADIDGISCLPTLLGRGIQPVHDFLYWEFHEGGFGQAVRFGDWKAVRLGRGQPVQLYELTTDPGERDDIAETHPEQVARAIRLFETSRTESPAFPVRENGNSLPQRGSGYAELGTFAN